MAANDRRKTGGGAQAPSPTGAPEPVAARDIPDLPVGADVVKAQPKKAHAANVAVGDVVIYSHRRTSVGSDGLDYIEMPMIVTRVYNSTTIAGVAFSESQMYCPAGAKPIDNVKSGKGGGTWRSRP